MSKKSTRVPKKPPQRVPDPVILDPSTLKAFDKLNEIGKRASDMLDTFHFAQKKRNRKGVADEKPAA